MSEPGAPGERRRSSEAAGVAGLTLAAAAMCCGLPVVLALGSGVVVLGLGLRSWALIAAGVLAAAAGCLRWRNPRRR